jgi:hypothetical protein
MAPVLQLSAAPLQAAEIESLFRSPEAQAVLEHPPVTRQNGFNILTFERAQIVEGERLVIEAWRKRLELFRDGTFIALGTFSDLLGWPREGAGFVGNPKVNSLALIEFTYDFFKTYEALLDLITPLPLPIRCEIGITGAQSLEHPLWLAPYALNSIGYEHPYARSEAPADTVTRQIAVEAGQDKPHVQPGQITYALVEQIYNWFGLTSETIPYASHELREIDPATF